MSALSAVANLTVESGVAVLTIDSPPVNALSHAVRQGILDGITRAVADERAAAIVLLCAGKTFIAGADITELGAPLAAPDLIDLENAIEGAPKAVIAAIHGTALGGGFEIALSCHYRVAVPSARCGLPEVHLGLIPGAGGTQRLPRLVGAEQALEMITSGNHVDAPSLHRAGVIDALLTEGELPAGAISFARQLIERGAGLKRVRDLAEPLEQARGKPELFTNFRQTHARKFRGAIAPEYAIRAIEAAVTRPFEEGMSIERQLFEELLANPQSQAQRYVFFAERQVWKIPDLPETTPTLPVKKVGIVGAGTMGGGIAMNFANIGLPVILVEAKSEALQRGLATIRNHYESTVKRGRLTAEDIEQRMALLRGSLQLEELGDCDLIIEAVFEDMSVKKDVFARLDQLAKPNAILATNTSSLNIDEIAAVTSRPQSVIGMHFFSPANVMRLLEVVRAQRTQASVIATAMQLARKIGKIAVLVRVCHGFVGNRMLFARQDQANAMLLEGALPWEIDKVLTDFGMPMGPFAMADLAGLDIGWSRERSSSSSIRDVLCEMDRRGQKTGAGYYDYDAQRVARPSATTEAVVRDFARRRGATGRALNEQEILERLLYPMINEGAKILEEGIALRPSDIDIVWVNGYGWPAYRGGPMYYADSVGLSTVVAKLREHAAKLGAGFSIAPLLEKLARESKRFQDLPAQA